MGEGKRATRRLEKMKKRDRGVWDMGKEGQGDGGKWGKEVVRKRDKGMGYLGKKKWEKGHGDGDLGNRDMGKMDIEKRHNGNRYMGKETRVRKTWEKKQG